jgi:MFS family permease
LILGRVVMGVGAAASEPGTLSIIRHVFPERRSRAKALGIWAAVSGMALALGPVIGGLLVGFFDWRAVFAFGLAFGAAAFVAGALALPESSSPAGRKLDVPGLVLGSGALGAATVATIEGERWGYATWWIIALYVLAAVFGWLFVRSAHRSADPVLPPAFLRNRTLVGSSLVAFSINVATFSIFFFSALYLQTIAGFSGYAIAGAFAGMCGAMVVAAIITGRAVARYGPRWPAVIGCLATAGGIGALLAVLSPDVDALTLVWPLALGGLGVGIALVSVNAAVLRVVPSEQSGVAASTVNTAREVGGVVGVAVFGAIVNAQLTSSLQAELKAIGVPSVFQEIVISGVTHGALRGGGGEQARAAAMQGGERAHMVHEVIDAAFRAFDAGLNTALVISAVLVGLAAIVALFLIRPRGGGEPGSHAQPA